MKTFFATDPDTSPHAICAPVETKTTHVTPGDVNRSS